MTVAALDPDLAGGRPYYRYYIAWTISGKLAMEIPLSGVTWSRVLRRAGAFSGTAFFDRDDVLRDAWLYTLPGRMSLYVTRNGEPVWGGMITRRGYDASSRALQIDATGFESYLYRRTIWHDLSYSNTVDQYQVVRNLINAMQTDFSAYAVNADIAKPHPFNSSIGLNVDLTYSGKFQDTQTWRGYELRNFGDTLEEFSNNLNGFEYDIRLQWNYNKSGFVKTLRFFEAPPSQLPLGSSFEDSKRRGIDKNFFEFPGNIVSLGYDDTIDDAATRYFVLGKQPDPVEVNTGAVDEEGNPVTESVEQPTPRGVYENEAYFSTQWPILEFTESSDHTEVSEQNTLNNYARVYGRQQTPTLAKWEVTVDGQMNPQVGSYHPGDWCRLLVTDPFMTQSIESSGETTKVIVKRISEFSVNVPDTNQLPEQVTLTLIDEWDEG